MKYVGTIAAMCDDIYGTTWGAYTHGAGVRFCHRFGVMDPWWKCKAVHVPASVDAELRSLIEENKA